MSKTKTTTNSQSQAEPSILDRAVGSVYELSARKGTYYAVLDSEDGAAAKIRTALETADVGFDAVAGTSLFVTGLVAHKVRTWNQAGTVQDEKLRVVLIDSEGRMISGLHDRLQNAAVEIAEQLVAVNGEHPIRIRLEKIGQKRSFRGYRVVDESIE